MERQFYDYLHYKRSDITDYTTETIVETLNKMTNEPLVEQELLIATVNLDVCCVRVSQTLVFYAVF